MAMIVSESGTGMADGGGARTEPPRANEGAVLVPILTDDISDRFLAIAIDFAEYAGKKVVIVGMKAVPEQTPLDHPKSSEVGRRRTLASLRRTKALAPPSLEIEGATRIGHRVADMILREVDDRDVEELVMERTGETSASGSLLGDSIDSVFKSVECNVVLATGTAYLEDVSSILVPVAGGPHSGFAVDVARAVAIENDAWIDLFHVLDPEASDEERRQGERYLEATRDRLEGYENVDTWILEGVDVAESIIEQTRYYDITVLGAPQKSRLRRFIFGSTTDAVSERACSTVVTVQAADAETGWIRTHLGHGT